MKHIVSPKKIILALCTSVFFVEGCTIAKTNSSSATNSSGSASSSASEASMASSSSTSSSSESVSSVPMSSINADADIALSSGASTCSSSSVTIDNAKNFITIASTGTYLVSGSLSEGAILITAEATDANDTVTLILNDVSIASSGVSFVATSTSSSVIYPGPIYSMNSAHLELVVPSSSSSSFTDSRSSSLATGDDTAAVFSNKLLKVDGGGSLNVTSTYNNGLASDSKVKINGVALTATVSNIPLKAHNAIILGGASEGGSFVLTSTAVGASSSDYPSAVRVDEVDDVSTPIYGNGEENDDIAGIEIKDADYTISSYGKCLSSEAYLYLEGGKGTMVSKADKGVKSELDLHVDGGDFAITALKDDCLHSSTAKVIATGGTYVLTSGTSDGCQGIKGETEVDISGGDFTVVSSYEGIAAHKILASGGTTIVNAADDGWSAGGTNSQASSECSIAISGGFHYSYANGDGMDSNGYFTISGGTVIVAGPNTSHDSPLDSGDGYSLTINGGTVIAYGITGMVESMVGTQNTVVLNSMSSVASGKYFVFLVGGSYYAVKLTRSATTLSASFPGYGANAYAIYVASSVTVASTPFAEGNFYSVSAYETVSTLASGTFQAATASHVGSGGGGGGGGGWH